MFGAGIILGFLSKSGTDLHSQAVILIIALFMLILGIITLRGTFQRRDNCPICCEKYRFGKKKTKN